MIAWRGLSPETGEPIEVRIDGGKIEEIRPYEGRDLSASVWLLPGLIDIQVNGYGGYDFNDPDVTPDTVRAAVQALWADGVTYCCPTVITAPPEAMLRSLRAIRDACRDPAIDRSIVGVHVEGPFISAEDGPRGAHPRDAVRPPDWSEFERWQEASGGRVRIVTLAPELPGAIPFIQRLAAEGVVPAIGHTGAAPEQIRDAVSAGARLSTHLGNGCHGVLPRHPNYLWEQAAADDLWASLIVDGHHLPPAVVKCLVRCKRPSHVILVSDAIAAAGLGPGHFRLGAQEVVVDESLRCSLEGSGYLAGSVIPLRLGVANVARFADVSFREAVAMATAHPARLLGVDARLGALRPGMEASLLLARWQPGDADVEVLRVMHAGVELPV
ncbi:MAG: N-acetylglucosamine-6-phosphate deacetylase [Anaerolineae bacterium]